jgi:hypothetical protein
MAKTQPADAPAPAAAVVDPDVHAQTAEQIKEAEQALGLATTTPATAVRAANVQMGVAPKSIEEAWRLSNFIAKSELVPKGYRGRPTDVLVAIQYGMEVGLPPMAALNSVFVTNGRPQLWGDGLLAVVMASRKYRDHDEYYMVGGERRDYLVAADLQKDDTMAVVTFWRTDTQRPRTATFSIAKAKKAGLWSKQGPWQEYPDRMLMMRARGFAAHDCFPDVLRGMVDEPLAPPPEGFERVDPETEVSRPKIVRRLSETTPPAEVPVPVAEEEITLGPVKVHTVEQFLGGYAVTLADGQKFDVEADLDAVEIEKFKGTDHALTFVCVKREGGIFTLKSFGLAD